MVLVVFISSSIYCAVAVAVAVSACCAGAGAAILQNIAHYAKAIPKADAVRMGMEKQRAGGRAGHKGQDARHRRRKNEGWQ